MREALRHMALNWKIYVPLMVFCATLSMQANAYGAFVAAVPMRRWDLPVSQVGHTIGLLMLIASPLGMWVTGTLMDRATRSHGVAGLCRIGFVAVAVVLVTSTLAPMVATPRMFFAFLAVMFAVGGSYFAITGSVLSLITPERNMGKTTAVVMFVYGIVGMGSGPAIVGVVSDRYFPGKGGIAYALGISSGLFTLVSLIAVTVLLFTVRSARGADQH
jgi:MFS family permease